VTDEAPRIPEIVDEGTLAHEIGERFSREGFEAWIVGGSVRDKLLGVRAPDIDIATDAKPSDMLPLLRGWVEEIWMQGVKFGTIGARGVVRRGFAQARGALRSGHRLRSVPPRLHGERHRGEDPER
jgi:hypothetical protein